MRALGVDGQIPLSAFGQRLKKSVTGRFIPGPPICVRMVLGFFPIASPWWRWPFAPMIALPQTPGGLFPYLGDQQASESVLASCSPIYRSLPRFVSLWSAGWSNFWFIPSPKNRTLLWTAGWNETKIGRDLQRGLQASQTLQDLLIPPGIYQYILGMWEAEDLPIFLRLRLKESSHCSPLRLYFKVGKHPKRHSMRHGLQPERKSRESMLNVHSACTWIQTFMIVFVYHLHIDIIHITNSFYIGSYSRLLKTEIILLA